MDINTWRGIGVIVVMVAFIAICWWAFSPKRKQKFREAANLPFADEQKQRPETNEAEDQSDHADSDGPKQQRQREQQDS